MIVRFTPRATEEFDALVANFADYHPATAEKFRYSIRKITELLSAHPELGAPFPTANHRLVGLRVTGVPRFRNHVVLYLIRQSEILILHVMSGRRDLESILASES